MSDKKKKLKQYISTLFRTKYCSVKNKNYNITRHVIKNRNAFHIRKKLILEH